MKRILITAVVSLAVGLASFAVPMQGQDQTTDQIIVEALQNERDEGFNFNLPAPGGLFINWVYVSQAPPDLANLNSLGVPDSDPAARHDRLTDLVYLADLARYIQAFPDDHQFDGDIATYTNIVAGEFNGHIDDRGWVYFVFKEMATSLPAFSGYADAMADNYDRRVRANIQRYGVGVPIHISTTGEPQGSYRCDETIEDAMSLVDNGAARGLDNYVSDGQALLTFVQSSCYASGIQMWAMEMGNIFTDSSRTMVNAFDQEVIKSGLMKAGGLSEILESLCYGETAAPGNGFGALAQSALDQLVPSTTAQGFGLWDPVHGGYYQGIRLTGDTIRNVTGYTLANSYKEVGRMATFLRTFTACNVALGNRYANAIAPMTQSVVNSYYHDGHGWPYQENNDFTLFTGYHVTQNWVTSEAIGHATRALLTARQ
jgi:hypothetical protein